MAVVDFSAQVVQVSKSQPVLVDFYADWCGPCKILKPTIMGVQRDRGDFQVVMVNVDENMELAQQFGVRSIPTTVLFVDGKPKSMQRGLISPTALNQWLDQSIGRVKEENK